jgi:uncharacterized protein YabN with tetrapyrrole methylase and pyrophosphatase domain
MPKKTKRKPRKSSPNAGPDFAKLVAVMARLRAPNGCPWDREQTHSTLRTYLIEEAYEVLDALDSTDDKKFAEELGDLLLQVLFHAQIAQEQKRFDITTVIREIHQKMIRRHPHVFGNKTAKTSAEVLRNWEQIKMQERRSVAQGESPSPAAFSSPAHREAKREPARRSRSEGESASPAGPKLRGAAFSSQSNPIPAQPESILDGVPRTLPALLEALQLTRKAARIGFDWPNIEGIFAKLHEESNELQQAIKKSPVAKGESASPAAFSSSSSSFSSSSSSSQSIESELGDLLFVSVNLARFLNLDPEIALKKSSAKFSRRFRSMENIAREKGTTLAQIPRPQLESLWDQAKQQEQLNPPK